MYYSEEVVVVVIELRTDLLLKLKALQLAGFIPVKSKKQSSLSRLYHCEQSNSLLQSLAQSKRCQMGSIQEGNRIWLNYEPALQIL